jgi:hypothetical protein
MAADPFAGKFYIGREYDLGRREIEERPVLYDPDDLTTHGVVVGMTGSGKTGLCIDILEEAALNGIPALLIDPKGDIANLLLHFPQLRPEDFQPWVDPDQARREGKSVEQLAQETAKLWRNGLADWDIDGQRIARVRQAAVYSVYTPGSEAGLPISILSSLRAPAAGWEGQRELLREKISTTVTALLSLVGVEADPMRSREHILLANIFEKAWQEGKDLDLVELIRQIQSPPFERLGAFQVDQFFPADERFELAMILNSLLASPAFQAWTEGQPLDPQSLLWTPEGKSRQTVFYLAHLSDRERMFFVTLLLSAVESWMRTQPGSPSLRAIMYFDEVLGFLPPVKAPPSKGPIIRLFKQARAFGLGMLLATQNPVDLDYKALSNAGTWFVGRLQTEQDKARLLDGLESASGGKGAFKRSEIDDLISTLGKRVFLLHNVHEKGPQIFYTRWAMAYLKGPITRDQLPALNALAGAARAAAAPAAGRPTAAAGPEPGAFSSTKPALPGGVQEFFLPNNLTLAQALKRAGEDTGGVEGAGLIYRPVLVAQAQIRFLNRKFEVDAERTTTAIVSHPDRRGIIRWDEYHAPAIDPRELDAGPSPGAVFAELEPPLGDAKMLKRLQKDFQDFAYRSAELRLEYNPQLKLVAKPGMTKAEFRALCSERARQALEEEVDKIKEKYLRKIKRLQAKIAREEQELAEDKAEFSARKMEEMATHFENVLGLFGGSRSRRRISSSLTKRRLTSKAKADIAESEQLIAAFKRDLEELELEMAEAVDEVEDRWEEAAAEIEEKVLRPYKKDVRVDLFGVAWFPFYRLRRGDQPLELPAYASGDQ